MQYQYGSVGSSAIYRHQVADGPQCSWKMLSLILFPIILFSAFVGHIVTIAFIGSTTRHHRDEKNLHQSLNSKTQATSEKDFNEYGPLGGFGSIHSRMWRGSQKECGLPGCWWMAYPQKVYMHLSTFSHQVPSTASKA